MFSPKLLWIDGVGVRKILGGDSLVIGGLSPGPSRQAAAEISLQAALSRHHLTLHRRSESLIIDPQGETMIGESILAAPTHCALAGDHTIELTLSKSVRLQLRRPFPGSATTVIDILSGHRTQSAIDRFIWMERVCVLGPGRFAHVNCPVNEDRGVRCVLFRQNDAIWFRPPDGVEWILDGRRQSGSQSVSEGGTVDCEELRFRIEAAPR